MILSSRPTDRRQLIEEAAGVTKYKARRRAAELKLEAAQQNLTRIDDIVFEVEKQRGTLKRQAAKARRYQKLRDELRRWEKVLFARKYRQLAETIESARGRLTDARERESVAAARVAEVESDLGRLRIELAEAEARATGAREAAHARELAINRQQQQIAFDREQVADARRCGARAIAAELESARGAPRAGARGAGRAGARRPSRPTRSASARPQALAAESEAYEAAHREIEGLEADVEAARSEVFSAINSATALRHALEHAATARERVAETLSKLRRRSRRRRASSRSGPTADRAAAADGLRRAHEAIEATRIARLARESELASARIEHEWRARSVRAARAGAGRPRSAAEVARGARSRARRHTATRARAVLAQANGKVSQQGAIADYLEVEAGYERAVEACLGDLLQHVVVERPEHAAAGFELVREAGRGPLRVPDHVAERGCRQTTAQPCEPSGLTPLPDGLDRAVVGRPRERPVRRRHSRAPSATRGLPTRTSARPAASRADAAPGRHAWTATCSAARTLVSGGSRDDARGILETKREIKELRERIDAERDALSGWPKRPRRSKARSRTRSHAIAALNAEQHKQEKAMVGLRGAAAACRPTRRRGSRRRASSSRASGVRPKRSATRSIAVRTKRARRSRGSTRSSARPTSG